MNPQRTYWHLEPLKRKPSEYEVVTSNLLYYVDRGFEVQTPLADWYQQHQRGSPLRCRDWERFRDPRETTYSKYTDLQRKREIFVDGLLAAIETTGYDRRLSPACVRVVDRVLGPLRYPVHGLQMAAAYVGSMAPNGRIVIACLLQAADEIRRVQRLAYRMRQLQETHEGFGARSKAVWEQDPAWQPLRKVIERPGHFRLGRSAGCSEPGRKTGLRRALHGSLRQARRRLWGRSAAKAARLSERRLPVAPRLDARASQRRACR
jgi:toluene monooxygenase system protein E